MQTIQATAQNLAFSWRGTDQMRSADDVRRAVESTGDVPADNVDAVVEALCPLLRAQGTLVERAVDECAYCSREVAAHGDVPALDDDAEWAERAKEHSPDCEWIATRAHRRDAR